MPWQPAGIKFTQCVSGQKTAFSPFDKKLCVGAKNDSQLLTYHVVLYQHAKFGEIELHKPAVAAKIGVFVCHVWSACACGT